MEETKNNLFEKIFLKGWRPYVWIILLVFLVYFQTFSFDFVYFDDDILIIGNQEFISDFSNISQAFKEDVFLSFFDIYYRPVLTISFMVDAHFGGVQPFIYHLTNTIFHLISSCLLFLLLIKLKFKREISFFFALIFTVHPILSQAVAWIPGRNDSLLAVFLLSAFIFFLKFLEAAKKKWLYLLLQLLFFTLAIFTKETAILFLPLPIIYLLLINKERIFSKHQLLIGLSWIPAMLFWFFLRKEALENTIITNIGEISFSVFSSLPAIIQYIGKIIFPLNLTVFPIIYDTTFIYGTLAIFLLIAAVIFSKNKRWNFILFGLAWLILLIIPTMFSPKSVAVPTFLEHRMYLPIIGLFIILLETDIVKSLLSQKKLLLVIGLAILLTFSVINITHSKNFKNRYSMWNKAVQGSPNSSFTHNNLGYIYYLDDRYDEAMVEFNKSLELNDKELLTHYHIGNIYLNQNQLEEAKKEYIEELKIDPLFDNALYNLGLVYSKQGNMDSAKFYWGKAIESNPQHSEALNSLGLIYINEENYTRAAEVLNKAVEYDPEFYGAWQNLGLLYFQQGNFDLAESAWLMTVKINPEFIKAHENLAVLYIQKGDMEKAVFHVQEILNQGKEVQP